MVPLGCTNKAACCVKLLPAPDCLDRLGLASTLWLFLCFTEDTMHMARFSFTRTTEGTLTANLYTLIQFSKWCLYMHYQEATPFDDPVYKIVIPTTNFVKHSSSGHARSSGEGD